MDNTVLVIEDNQDMAENVCNILKLAHYNILIADNGKTGVELAQQKLPDIILCDIMMPLLDGYGVLHILARDSETANIPFIFLTGKADKNDLRTGMSLGADDYITKPFDGHDLLKVIETRLKKSELLKSKYNADSHESNFLNKSRERKGFQQLAEKRPTRLYKKRDFVFMEGQIPSDLFYINSGEVKTYKVNYDGKELITGIYKEGDFIGYVPLLKGIPHHESAEVLEDAEICIIPKSDFIDILYSNKELMNKFLGMLSNDLIEAESRLLDLAYQSVRQRLARTLLKIQEHHAPPAKTGIISISRKDISNMIGTATESLNRTLADFKDEGLIEICGEGIKIINKGKLENLLH